MWFITSYRLPMTDCQSREGWLDLFLLERRLVLHTRQPIATGLHVQSLPLVDCIRRVFIQLYTFVPVWIIQMKRDIEMDARLKLSKKGFL